MGSREIVSELHTKVRVLLLFYFACFPAQEPSADWIVLNHVFVGSYLLLSIQRFSLSVAAHRIQVFVYY